MRLCVSNGGDSVVELWVSVFLHCHQSQANSDRESIVPDGVQTMSQIEMFGITLLLIKINSIRNDNAKIYARTMKAIPSSLSLSLSLSLYIYIYIYIVGICIGLVWFCVLMCICKYIYICKFTYISFVNFTLFALNGLLQKTGALWFAIILNWLKTNTPEKLKRNLLKNLLKLLIYINIHSYFWNKSSENKLIFNSPHLLMAQSAVAIEYTDSIYVER